jgi:plastocyanin
MRRFLVLALACGLAAALAQGAPAKTSRCLRKPRVAKHIPRRCHRRRVRHPVTRSVAPAPASGGTPSPAPPGGSAPAPAPAASEEAVEPPPPTVTRVQVSASEFYYTLSRSTVPAGKVIFEFLDNGQDEHNLNVGSEAGELELSFATAQPKAISDQAVVLKKGVYTLFCSLPEHESKGMKATLTVQ